MEDCVPGTRMRLKGLVGRVDLNGSIAVVMEPGIVCVGLCAVPLSNRSTLLRVPVWTGDGGLTSINAFQARIGGLLAGQPFGVCYIRSL